MVRFSLIHPLPFLDLYHSHCRRFWRANIRPSVLFARECGICVLQGQKRFIDYVMKRHSAKSAIEDFATAWKVWLWQKTRNCLTTTKRMWLILRPRTCSAREVQMPITHWKTRTLAVQTVQAGAPDLTSTDACIGMGWCEAWKQWCL